MGAHALHLPPASPVQFTRQAIGGPLPEPCPVAAARLDGALAILRHPVPGGADDDTLLARVLGLDPMQSVALYRVVQVARLVDATWPRPTDPATTLARAEDVRFLTWATRQWFREGSRAYEREVERLLDPPTGDEPDPVTRELAEHYLAAIAEGWHNPLSSDFAAWLASRSSEIIGSYGVAHRELAGAVMRRLARPAGAAS